MLGARDPAAPIALRAYADHAQRLDMDPEYVRSIRELADDFERYRETEGSGDADAGPHRKDYPGVVDLMGGRRDDVTVTLRRERKNAPKTKARQS